MVSFPQFNNISFKASITDKEIDSLKSAKQYFSDCYLLGTLEALSNSENGREVLKEQIQHSDILPNHLDCYLYKKNGEKELYSVPTSYRLKGYEKVYDNQANDIVRSLDISVNEFERKHDTKPFFCKIGEMFKDYSFEYYLPSKFMEMLTGVKPRVIGETDLNLSLIGHKEELMELFKKMVEEKNYSFIFSTGPKALDGHKWHVYVIEDIDLENETITVKEKRENIPQTMSIDDALKSFKSIAGYLNSDLEK